MIVVRYGSSAHILVNTSGTNNAIRILEASHRVDLGANNITAALDFVVGSLSSTSGTGTTTSHNATTSENSLTLNVNNSRSLLFQISTSVEAVDATKAASLSVSIQNLGLESYIVSSNVNTAAGLEVLASQPSSDHVFVCNGDLSNVDSVVTTIQPYLQPGLLSVQFSSDRCKGTCVFRAVLRVIILMCVCSKSLPIDISKNEKMPFFVCLFGIEPEYECSFPLYVICIEQQI